MARIVFILLLLAAPAHADRDDHELARRALEAGEILPLSEVLGAAEAARSGRVIELELDREDGGWVYELELVTPDGHIYEMEIDAATGMVLELEREEDD